MVFPVSGSNPYFYNYMGYKINYKFLERLSDPQDYNTCIGAVRILKDSIIGSNRQKTSLIKMGVIQTFIRLLLEDDVDPVLLIEIVITLGSLAKGTTEHLKSLSDAGVVNVLLRGLYHPYTKYTEACVRSLRTVLLYQHVSSEVLFSDRNIIPRLIQMTTETEPTIQECIMTILASICKTVQHQNLMCSYGVVDGVAVMLCSQFYKVQISSLKCLAKLCFQNGSVSEVVANSYCDGKSVPDILSKLMSRDQTNEMQLASSKCMTYIFRAGALPATDSRILFKALPTLVRMCQIDASTDIRIEGAETLSYLTEVDTSLQQIASISDHLIPTLSEMFKWSPLEPQKDATQELSGAAKELLSKDKDITVSEAMKCVAFKAFSSLAANDEEIRKKIIDKDDIMDSVVIGLTDPSDSVRLAAVRCLHSLSRSVQQLRTTFQDHAVWRPLMKLLHNASDDVLIVASSTLCNLLLEFSPSKEPILECGAVELLCGLSRRKEPALRLNGVWALMNMAFQADQKIKSQILAALGSDQIFHLLTDTDVNVLMKSLGLLRNLLSTKPHIDHIMGLHGKQVMQAVILILEGDQKAEVKEQALCILANIADGDFAKNFIMSNEDVIKKLASYMMHSNVRLQIAATFCISNLIWKEEEGSLERQAKLKEFGIQQLLQQLITTADTILFDKVKTALQQFPSQGAQ